MTPKENLSVYKWGTRTGEDYFCLKCGILPFRKPSNLTKEEIANGKEPFDGWAVNVRCLENLNSGALPKIPINGKAITIL